MVAGPTLTEDPAAATPPAVPDRRRSRWTKAIGYAVGVAVIASAIVGWRALHPATPSATPQVQDEQTALAPAHWRRPTVTAAGLEQRTGIRIVRATVTGGGGLLDLRYEVLDPDKAAAVHDPTTPPAVVSESTGLVIKDLLMGHFHSGRYKTAVTYYLVFINPGGWIRSGDQVTVLLGDTQVKHVVVF